MSRLSFMAANLFITVVAVLITASVGAENRFEGLAVRGFSSFEKGLAAVEKG